MHKKIRINPGQCVGVFLLVVVSRHLCYFLIFLVQGRQECGRIRGKIEWVTRRTIMKKKTVIKDLVVLLIAMAALICAAVNLNASLNMLGSKE